MDISKVGVVGCGLMGSGIAEVAAKSGFEAYDARCRAKCRSMGGAAWRWIAVFFIWGGSRCAFGPGSMGQSISLRRASVQILDGDVTVSGHFHR